MVVAVREYCAWVPTTEAIRIEWRLKIFADRWLDDLLLVLVPRVHMSPDLRAFVETITVEFFYVRRLRSVPVHKGESFGFRLRLEGGLLLLSTNHKFIREEQVEAQDNPGGFRRCSFHGGP